MSVHHLPRKRTFRAHTLPSIDELQSIPCAVCGEYELSDKEVKTLRGRIYAINKDGICKYMTRRSFPYLMVWRVK